VNAPTLVFVRGHYIDGHLSHYPGEEVPPGLIPAEAIPRMLDQGELKECDPAVRPSLYRVFHRFCQPNA
jgi:hypothetical protein